MFIYFSVDHLKTFLLGLDAELSHSTYLYLLPV